MPERLAGLWKTASPVSTSCTVRVPPVVFGVASSVTDPVAVPVMVAASLVPVMVTTMAWLAVASRIALSRNCNPLVVLLLLLPCALCLLPGYVVVIRSHAFTYLLFALTLLCLESIWMRDALFPRDLQPTAKSPSPPQGERVG